MFLAIGMKITIKGHPEAGPLSNSQHESPASTMHSPRENSELEESPLGTSPPTSYPRHKNPARRAMRPAGPGNPPLRACLSKPLDLRDFLGDDAADVLRLGHHAIRLKEAVVAATVANRGNVNARVL